MYTQQNEKPLNFQFHEFWQLCTPRSGQVYKLLSFPPGYVCTGLCRPFPLIKGFPLAQDFDSTLQNVEVRVFLVLDSSSSGLDALIP